MYFWGVTARSSLWVVSWTTLEELNCILLKELYIMHEVQLLTVVYLFDVLICVKKCLRIILSLDDKLVHVVYFL